MWGVGRTPSGETSSPVREQRRKLPSAGQLHPSSLQFWLRSQFLLSGPHPVPCVPSSCQLSPKEEELTPPVFQFQGRLRVGREMKAESPQRPWSLGTIRKTLRVSHLQARGLRSVNVDLDGGPSWVQRMGPKP